MKMIERYLVIIISMTGMTLSVNDRFSEAGEMFCNYVHNKIRTLS